MRIAHLKVSNHRAIPDLDLVVREHLVLVGPNESGKTSLLRLLDGVLRGSLGVLYGLLDGDSLRDPGHPLVVEVEFDSFTVDDKAGFPDQIEVLADGGMRLRLVLRATSDQAAGAVAIERFFLKPGLQLPATMRDLALIGWAYLPAGRSPDRELGASRSSAVRNLLGAVELGDSLADIVRAIEALHEAVHDAPALQQLREGLASALGELLSYDVKSDDLASTPGPAGTLLGQSQPRAAASRSCRGGERPACEAASATPRQFQVCERCFKTKSRTASSSSVKRACMAGASRSRPWG